MSTTPAQAPSVGRRPGRTLGGRSGAAAPDGWYADVGKLPLLLLCAYVFAWYLQLGSRWGWAGAIRLEFLLAGTLLVIAAARMGNSAGKPIYPLYGFVALYLLTVLIQVPFSYDYDRSYTVFIDRVVQFSTLAVFIGVFIKSPTGLRYLLVALFLAWLKMGQEGLWGRITGNLVWQNQGVMRLHGSTRLFAHPNSFSGFALGTVPFIFYLFPLGNRYVKGALLLMAVFAANIIVFTGSRTGYVGLGFFVLYATLQARSKFKTLLLIAMVILLLFPFIPEQYVQRFTTIFSGEEAEGHSKERRTELLGQAWTIFLENPLGIGVAAFPKYRGERFGRAQDTHNLYLEIATNLGIQGVVFFLAFVFSMIKVLKRTRIDLEEQIDTLSRGDQPEDDADEPFRSHLADLRLIHAVTLAISAFLIIRLALGIFGHDLYEIYWWFALGLTVATYNLTDRARARTAALTESLVHPDTAGVPGRNQAGRRLGAHTKLGQHRRVRS